WLIMDSVQAECEQGDDERGVAILLDDLALLGSHDDLQLLLVVVVHVFAGQCDLRLGTLNGLLAQGAPVTFLQGGARTGQPLVHRRDSLGLEGKQYGAARTERKLAKFTKIWSNCSRFGSCIAGFVTQLVEIKAQYGWARLSQ